MKKTKKYFLLVFLTLYRCVACAQQDTAKAELPFKIHDVKKLSDEDIANKKEGFHVEGEPDINYDPIDGMEYGVEGFISYNGKRSDPFFNYTPYRQRLGFEAINSTRNQKLAKLSLDVPYIFNTPWRLRMEGGAEKNPNQLFFGTTEQSLNKLADPVSGILFPDYRSYTGNLKNNGNEFYNRYLKEEYIFNISAERSFFDSKARVLTGYEIAHFNISSLSNNSLILSETAANKILGLGKGIVTIFQLGLVYDTRDLEPDPGSGIFSEITNEYSSNAIGSKYNFNKTFIHFRYYKKIFPKRFSKMVLAYRFGTGYTAGNAPFFEYNDEWSSEGSMEGLGGDKILRGYKQNRFVGRGMSFMNVELRCKLFETKIFNEHFAFNAVPFFDAGTVWAQPSHLGMSKKYRYSEGLGIRIAWNVSTILRFDYAISEEDRQFFFVFSHPF